MAYKSNLPAAAGQLTRAREAALIAAANELVNAVKKKFRPSGYTSRAFVNTMNIGKSVFRTAPVITPTFGEIKVGPSGEKTSLVALAWELGHQNLFTRRYERVEKFYPALTESADDVRAAYALTMRRILGDG